MLIILDKLHSDNFEEKLKIEGAKQFALEQVVQDLEEALKTKERENLHLKKRLGEANKKIYALQSDDPSELFNG